jgi:hypothetical protein
MSSLGTLINGSSNVVNRDILKDTSRPITNSDYFDIVITDLNPNTSYNVQFAWVYPDDTRSDYSATYTFSTNPEDAPAIPSTPSVTAGPGLINVTWNGNNSLGTALQNYARVNLYVDGIFRDSFFGPATKSIALAKGTYSITLRSSSSTNIVSDPSTAASATVTTDATDAASALSALDTKLTIGGAIIADSTTKVVAKLNAASTGFVIYSSSSGTENSGNRIIINSEGIAGFRSVSGQDKTSFAIVTQDRYYDPSDEKIYTTDAVGRVLISAGSAFFAGQVRSSSGVIGGFEIGASTLTHTSGTTTIGIYNAANSLLTYSGGIKISNSLSNRYTTYLVEQGVQVFPSNRDGQNAYAGAFFTDQWYLHNADEGINSEFVASFLRHSSGVIDARILLNNFAGLEIKKNGSSYAVRAYNSQGGSTANLNNSALRNVYVSSTAGEPTPSSPANGDIKLEW